MLLGRLFAHTAGTVHECELVGVDIEVGERLTRGRVRGRSLQQLPLRTDGDVLTRRPGERTRGKSGKAVKRTMPLETPVAPIPAMRARLESSPSLAPKTAARRFPAIRRRPRSASARTTSP